MDNILIKELVDKYKEKIRYIGNQHPVIQQVKHIQNNTNNDSDKLLVAEGMWSHQILLQKKIKIYSLIICPELIYSSEGAELAESLIKRADEAFIVSRKLFEKISERDGPDGFASVVQIPGFDTGNLELVENALVLVLDGLEKPGNIGTIIRTCDGAGVDAVFICNKKARVTNPRLVKGSMGAVFNIPIVEFDDVNTCVKWLESHGFSIYLADTRAERTYKDMIYNGNTALVMGCERYGISEAWYNSDPQLIAIPMLGICDSLNVGVAASILAYEICMRRLQTTARYC